MGGVKFCVVVVVFDEDFDGFSDETLVLIE